jgi:uncharacterized secreted repeat protein (TIGR03808 family)
VIPTRRALLLAAALPVLPRPAAAAPDLAAGGERDVAAALQALVDKAARDGRIVQLGAGRYRLDTTLRLAEGVTLKGVGPATELVGTGGGAAVAARGLARAGLADLCITAGRGSGDPALVTAMEVGDFRLDGVGVAGAAEDGVRLERSGGRITRCRIERAAHNGLFAYDCRDLVVSDCDVVDCGDGGILVHRSAIGADGASLTGNRIARIGAVSGGSGQNGNGINVFRADNVLVAQNRIADCAFSAIRANSTSDIRILGNAGLNSGETALYVEFAYSGAVVADNLIDGAVNGISVTNFNDGGRLASVSGNIVRRLRTTRPGFPPDHPGFGLGIAVEADATVAGNIVEDAAIGLVLGTHDFTRDLVASGNVIRRAGIGIGVAVTANAGAILVSGNIVSESRRGAVMGLESYRPATQDLLAAGLASFRNVTLSGNKLVP